MTPLHLVYLAGAAVMAVVLHKAGKPGPGGRRTPVRAREQGAGSEPQAFSRRTPPADPVYDSPPPVGDLVLAPIEPPPEPPTFTTAEDAERYVVQGSTSFS